MCSPPNTSLNSVATGAYSFGCATSPPRVFMRAILDMFVVIASDCSISMQNVNSKNNTVIIDRMNMTVEWCIPDEHPSMEDWNEGMVGVVALISC